MKDEDEEEEEEEEDEEDEDEDEDEEDENAMQLKPDDRRFREERFQNGHMIGSCWDTVARWMNMRAQRDAD
eukprot:2034999-Pyramimonas_sp.AAC.1